MIPVDWENLCRYNVIPGKATKTVNRDTLKNTREDQSKILENLQVAHKKAGLKNRNKR